MKSSVLWILVVPCWTGLLVLPFTGVRTASLLVAGMLVGAVFWRLTDRYAHRFLTRWSSLTARISSDFLPLGSRPAVWGTGLVLLILSPLVINNYFIDVLTLTGIYVVLALGLNIVVGLTGLLDLGYVAFYAIGAYTYALLSVHFGVPFWIGLPISGLAAAAFGMVLGLVTLRLRGDYLAIVTLGFIQIVHLVLNNWDGLTNGPNGILHIGRPSAGGFQFYQPAHFYYLILGIALLTFWVVHRLNESRIGRAWTAIREDETAAAAMGIPTVRFKILAFTLGATWAGVAGCFFAAKYGFVSPESFNFFESVFVLCMVVLGGMGSLPGAVLGASLLVILPELLRGLETYRMLIFGMLLVLMMVFRPQGLIPGGRRKIVLPAPGS